MNITTVIINGIGIILIFILSHQAFITYKRYKNYKPKYTSQRDEGRIVDLESGVSKSQDKPVVPF